MKRYAVLTVLFVVMTAAQYVLRLRFEASIQPTDISTLEALPSPSALRWMAMGQRNIVADYYWLRTLAYFGDADNNNTFYPLAEPLVSRVLALDPYFREAYTFAGTALTLNPDTVERSNALLRQGLTYRPDLWQIPYYLGFNLFYFNHDYAAAAELLAKAARLPGVPAIVGPLAARVASQADLPEVGLGLIDEMLERTTDPQIKAVYEERRRALLMDLQIGELTKGIATFEQSQGRAPRDMNELGAYLGLPAPVVDPYGAVYELHDDGTVHSQNDAKRLRIYRDDPQ